MAIKNVRLVRRVGRTRTSPVRGSEHPLRYSPPTRFFGQARGQQQYVATLSQGGVAKGEGEQRQSTLSVVLRFLVNEIVCQMKRKASKFNNLNRLNSAATLSCQSFFSPLLLAFPAQRKRKCVAVQDFKIEFRVAFCVILKNRPQNHFKAT